MANRSDRRLANLSPTRAREAARLIENEARGNPSRPGASSDARQAGRIYDCNRVPHRVDTALASDDGPIFSTVAKLVEALERSIPEGSQNAERKKLCASGASCSAARSMKRGEH